MQKVNTRRISAFLLLLIAVMTYGYLTGVWSFPITTLIIALVALPGGLQAKLTKERQMIYSLVLSFPFLVQWRLSFSQDYVGLGLFDYRLTYFLARYFLCLHTAQFFLRREQGMSLFLLLYPTTTMICAGNLFATPEQARIYQALSYCFAGAATLYCGTFQKASLAIEGRWKRTRILWSLSLLLSGLFGAGVLGFFLSQYGNVLDQMFVNVLNRIPLSVATGFGKTTKLDSVKRMKIGPLEKRIALRVFSKEAPGYLRGRVYSGYLNARWSMTGPEKNLTAVLQSSVHLPLGQGQGNFFYLTPQVTRTVSWQVFDLWPDSSLEQVMFTPASTAVVRAPVNSLEVDEHQVPSSTELDPGLNYSAYVPQTTTKEILSTVLRARLTSTPKNLDPRILQRAKHIFIGCHGDSAKIAAVIQYFVSNYRYSLDIQIPPGKDPLTHFLLERPPAYCEYFASGAAVLLRLAKVPARYVTGFVAMERNTFGDYWIARNRDAHAWVEAYDRNKGWVLVEATPPAGRPTASYSGKLSDLWELCRFRFLELVLKLRTEGWHGLIDWFRDRLDPLMALLTAWTLLGVLIKLCLLLLIFRVLLRRERKRPVLPIVDPNLQRLQSLLAQVDTQMKIHGLMRSDHETLHQFADRLGKGNLPKESAALFSSWYKQYANLRYGHEISSQAIDTLVAMQQSIREVIKGFDRDENMLLDSRQGVDP